ncbi:MAG: NUDIX domain-containing protein [Candidatus Absconditabacterales bacterium]
MSIQSIGGILYQIINNEPYFFIMKRKALSGKIERIAPKGKVQPSEDPELTCVREISEETGMDINQLHIKTKLSGGVELKNMNFGKGATDKMINYFLVHYQGEPDAVRIPDEEGLTGMYKWCTLTDVTNLVPYKDLRAVFREAYEYLSRQTEKQRIFESIKI